ncbi:unnamed protein product [Protopolystoma xenopodis]|uniref:FHA domain-containing protein n=1 Tax=Protopolystoma xenopodis TaxID=117903 RepID=A0A3S5BRY1_9PLAT|nr:unnamed protein product [Protopolystoma xenopodis]
MYITSTADFEANSYHGMSADILTTMLSQDTNLLRLLTHRWVTQLLSSHEYAVTPNPTLTRLDCEYRVGLSESECRLAARAVLIPVEDTLGPTIRMSYRQLNVGTDPDSHLRLSQYQLKSSLSPTAAMTTRHCRFVSPTHAVVFYDEWTRHYELLNYSEHGTLVDSVLYSNDISEKPICQLKVYYRCYDVQDIVDPRLIAVSFLCIELVFIR